MRLCDYPGCGKARYGRGYCVGHYRQLTRGYELAPLKGSGTPRPSRAGAPKPGPKGLQVGQVVTYVDRGVATRRQIVGFRRGRILLGAVA